MYVILLDRHDESMRLKFMTAVHAKIAGNEDVDIPDLDEEREDWEAWLMSDVEPAIAEAHGDREVVYAALFPDNRTGASVKEMLRRMTPEQRAAIRRKEALETLAESGHLEEVSENG